MQSTPSGTKPAPPSDSAVPVHPLAAVAAALTAPFPESDIETKPGKGGTKLRYVKAPAIIRRLNAVAGPGNWSVDVAVADAETGAVRTALTVLGVTMADFGDSNNPKSGDKGVGAQVFKEAASDGLKRAARLFGIGLELWESGAGTGAGHAPAQNRTAAPATGSPAARPSPARTAPPAQTFAERLTEPVQPKAAAQPAKIVVLEGVRCTHQETARGFAYKSVATCATHTGQAFWTQLDEQGRMKRWSHRVADGEICHAIPTSQ